MHGTAEKQENIHDTVQVGGTCFVTYNFDVDGLNSIAFILEPNFCYTMFPIRLLILQITVMLYLITALPTTVCSS